MEMLTSGAAPRLTCEPMGTHSRNWADLRTQLPDIEWLWPGWLPRGFVVMLTGESGMRKSALALRIAATVVIGSAWPDGAPAPAEGGKVLWCETEAALAINFSRAMAWGGEPLLRGMIHPSEDVFADIRLDNKDDLGRITELAHRGDIHLLVVDSLSGSHGGDENTVDAARVVKTLAQIAQESRTPVLLTHHLRKPRLGEDNVVTLNRVRGSTALVQYARLIWAVDAPNPLDRSAVRLSVIKNNLGQYPEPIGMSVDEAGVTFTSAPAAPTARPSAYAEAEQFLLDRLSDGRRVPAREMELARDELGIADITLRRAKAKLGVLSEREAGQWVWSLM